MFDFSKCGTVSKAGAGEMLGGTNTSQVAKRPRLTSEGDSRSPLAPESPAPPELSVGARARCLCG